jgi:hypothetical protein
MPEILKAWTKAVIRENVSQVSTRWWRRWWWGYVKFLVALPIFAFSVRSPLLETTLVRRSATFLVVCRRSTLSWPNFDGQSDDDDDNVAIVFYSCPVDITVILSSLKKPMHRWNNSGLWHYSYCYYYHSSYHGYSSLINLRPLYSSSNTFYSMSPFSPTHRIN